jgi:hypothetical protein
VNKQLLLYGALGVLFSGFVLFNWAWPLVDLYKGRLSDDPLPFHFLRASGFSGFPTDFGCLLVLILLLLRAQWRRGELKTRTVVLGGAVVIGGIVASAARGAVVQLAGLALMWVFFWCATRLCTVAWLLRKLSRRWVILFAFFMTAVAMFLVAAHRSGHLMLAKQQVHVVRYVTDALAQPDESVLHRFIELRLAQDVIGGEQSVPRGMERENLFGLQVIEGYWSHYTVRYGIFGVLIGLAIATLLVSAAYSARTLALGEALFYWLVSFFLFVAPFSDVMARSRGIALYFTLLGLALGWRHAESTAVPGSMRVA